MKQVQELNEKGQPVLIGTASIEKNEKLGNMLKKAGIEHYVLNAKNNEREAGIVAHAGEKGSVTLATNIAGRGTDIVLGDGVKELGGLFVLGSERHESRRIDNQLRGRAGRQGDPGVTQFFVSTEDDLMRIFGGERVAGIMDRLKVDDETPIENRVISRALENAQKKVEGFHFDQRKNVVQYDDVMNRHRKATYAMRREILRADDISKRIKVYIEDEVTVLGRQPDPSDRRFRTGCARAASTGRGRTRPSVFATTDKVEASTARRVERALRRAANPRLLPRSCAKSSAMSTCRFSTTFGCNTLRTWTTYGKVFTG